MPKPLAICIEDLDSEASTRYMQCVALPGRQPGLRLDEAGRIVWRSEDRVLCELWVSADERLILYRTEIRIPVTLHRSGRSLDLPHRKPVVVIDQDQLDVGSRHLRLHIHGWASRIVAPTPFVPKTRQFGRLAEAAATAVIIGAVATAGGCADESGKPADVTSPGSVVPGATFEVTVIANPPEVAEVCTNYAYRMGWVMDYADANNLLNEVFHPDSSFQFTLWDNETYRDLVSQALLETGTPARVRLWQQAEDVLINEQAVILPLFYYDRTGLIRADVEYVLAPIGAPHYMKWTLPEGRDTLRVRLADEPPSLDPLRGTDATSQAVLNQLMEAPFRYTGEGTIEPAGAESFEVSSDGTIYTVYLRRDALWSDGEPVLAQHYVDGLIHLLNPAMTTDYAYIMYYIPGAEAFNTGETNDPSTVGVTALGDYTLQFTLDSPKSFFDNILAMFTMYPVRLDVIEQHGDHWTEPGNFVGNGPYTLVEWTHGEHLALEANPNYHSAADVSIQRVEYPIIIEEAAALAAFERGDLDISGYPDEELPRILDELSEHFVRLPRPGTYYIGFNTQLTPTDNLNLRKALSSAVDRRAILDNVLEMPWRIEACGVIPPEVPGYRGCGEAGFSFDLDAAQGYLQAAMAELGVEDPGDISFQLWFNRGNEEVIEAVAEMWETNLGINVNVVNMEWGAYLETLDVCNN